MIELGKIFTLTDEPGTITPHGRRQIEAFIAAQRINSDDWKAVNPNEPRIYLQTLPETWVWKWLVQKGEYRGTFPKRVSSFYYKVHGLKTPETFNTQIGNLAKTHSQTTETHTFDFTDSFDWYDGEFGDSNSCFWGSNSAALDMLTDNGALAIRFYDENEDGFARAWIVPIDDRYIVFNGYGLQTVEIAQVFARFLGLDYSYLTLANNRTAGGVLYINGAYGYIVGETSQITNIRHHDFKFDEIDGCESCGRSLNQHDAYYSPNGYPYCQDCFYEIYDTCEKCGETYDRDDFRLTADEQLLCERCLREYNECESCYELHRTDALRGFKGGLFCPNCLHD